MRLEELKKSIQDDIDYYEDNHYKLIGWQGEMIKRLVYYVRVLLVKIDNT